jgi:hypothetical protein
MSMLYLHCGWPRTSTTSLQTVVYESRERLYADGLLYPEEWTAQTRITHRGLADLLQESLDSERVLDDFERFLAAHADRDVLFSVEMLSNWVGSEQRQDALLKLLEAAMRVMPVRCIWTLRRHDELLVSLVLLNLKMAPAVPPALSEVRAQAPTRSRRLGGVGDLDSRFAGMRRVERALDGDVTYLEYDPDGTHNLQLLRLLELPPALESDLGEALRSGPRLHSGPTLKEAAALLNVEALSKRAGVELDRGRLQRLFTRPDFSPGELRFADDQPCDPVDAELRRELHERALAAARRHDLRAYVEFFADAEIEPHDPPDLGQENITDRDLEQLVAHASEPDPAPVA